MFSSINTSFRVSGLRLKSFIHFDLIFVYGERWGLVSFLLFKNFILSSEIHLHDVQVCYIGKHVPWWFATPINPSPRY